METTSKRRVQSQLKRRPAGKAKTLPSVLLVPEPTWRAVAECVYDPRVFDLPIHLLDSPLKFGNLATARAVVALILRTVWGDPDWTQEPMRGWATVSQIGKVIGRDHTSTCSAIARMQRRCKSDPYMLELVIFALELLAERVEPRDVLRVRRVQTRLEALCAA